MSNRLEYYKSDIRQILQSFKWEGGYFNDFTDYLSLVNALKPGKLYGRRNRWYKIANAWPERQFQSWQPARYFAKYRWYSCENPDGWKTSKIRSWVETGGGIEMIWAISQNAQMVRKCKRAKIPEKTIGCTCEIQEFWKRESDAHRKSTRDFGDAEC